MNKTKCNMCGKELEYYGFACPIMCDKCSEKWNQSLNSNYNYTYPYYQYNLGWVCPKCGAVMGPNERTCINCKGYQDWKITWTSNNGTGSPTFTNNVSVSNEVKNNEC